MALPGNSSATNHLLVRIQGEPQALADLFARHKERLRRMVRLRLDPRLRGRFDSSPVLDLVYQDVCQRISEYHAAPVPFFFWLRQLTGLRLQALANEHLPERQDEGAISLYRGALPEVNSVALAAQLLGQATSATQAAARADMQLCLQDALNSMDRLDREILTLCHFENLSNAEAALALGIEPKVASQCYVRAVKKLKEIMQSLPGGRKP